jgi:hypothetical protein
MFGCIGRLVVLGVLLVAGAAAWLTRDRWQPALAARMGWRRPAPALAWEPITPQGAARVRAALDTLARPTGAGFINVAPADLAAFALEPVLEKLARAARDSASGPSARADSGTVAVRGSIRMADLGGAAALGPLGGVLEGTQRIEVRGRIEVPQAGHAYFLVTRIVIGQLTLPAAAVPRVVDLLVPRRGKDLPSGAVAVPLPPQVADVRVIRGRVTLYKGPR